MDKDQKNKDNKKKSDANETQKKSQDAKPHAQKHNDVKEEKSNNNSDVEQLREKVELLENELNQTKDKALRALADAENTKKRFEREKNDAIAYANKAIIKDLIPSLDSLDLAISTTKDEDIKKGIELVRTTFITALGKWGLEVIDDKGKEYDPMRHEACLFDVNPDAKEETVLETLQKGYALHSQVIRPSKVKVEKCE